MKLNDEYFKQMASSYVERDGKQLQLEIENAEQEIKSSSPLDLSVKRKIQYLKRQKSIRMVSRLAACAAIAVISVGVLRQRQTPMSDQNAMFPDQQIDHSTVLEGTAISEDSQLMAEALPPSEAVMDSDESSDSAFLPLNFVLAEQYSIRAVEQDQAETIYYLETPAADPIVLSVQYTTDPVVNQDLSEIVLKEGVVQALSADRYHIVYVQKEGLLYTMSCQYELNTLLELSKNIF